MRPRLVRPRSTPAKCGRADTARQHARLRRAGEQPTASSPPDRANDDNFFHNFGFQPIQPDPAIDLLVQQRLARLSAAGAAWPFHRRCGVRPPRRWPAAHPDAGVVEDARSTVTAEAGLARPMPAVGSSQIVQHHDATMSASRALRVRRRRLRASQSHVGFIGGRCAGDPPPCLGVISSTTSGRT